MIEHTGDDIEETFDPRLELITDYLMGALDPVQVQEVKARLETDADFRAYCAPLILAWSIPPKHEREPMSRAELARHWDTFTKRAGFIHQKKKARRRRWLTLGVVVLALAISYATLGRTVSDWYHDRRDFHAVAPAADWVQFGEGRDVLMAPGSRIRVANKPDSEDVVVVHLTGAARFRTRVTDSNVVAPQLHFISVVTRGGSAMFGYGDFTVKAAGDTTFVESNHPVLRQFIAFMPLPTNALVMPSGSDLNPLKLDEGQRARVVRGQRPTLLP